MSTVQLSLFQAPAAIAAAEREAKGYRRLRRGTLLTLNMGAGRQSVTLLALCEAGELPMPDLVIHADTGQERLLTIKYVEEVIRPACKRMGVPFLVVRNGNLHDDTLASVATGSRAANAPYWVVDENGKRGRLRRACTPEFKIVPIERAIRAHLGIAKGHRVNTKARPNHVEQWIGIATEEAKRAGGTSGRKWATLTYPLLDLGLSTEDCIATLERLGWPVPVKSACFACPFRNDSSWVAMKRDHPEEFARAVEFDEKLRFPFGRGRLNWGVGGGEQFPVEPSRLKGALHPAFVHPSCKPLGEIEFKDNGQGEAFGGSYC